MDNEHLRGPLPVVSVDDQIACVKREIALRKNVYPGFVQKGRMKQAEADKELERMTAVLYTLFDLKDSLK